MARHLAFPAIVQATSAATMEAAAMMSTLAMASCRTMTKASGEVVIPVAEAEAGAVCNPFPVAIKWKNKKSIFQCKEM
jgi:hypothetical protein